MDTNETNLEDAANASRLKTAALAAVADPEPDPEPEPERDGLPLRQRRVVLGIMVSGTTAACISQSMMIAALPAVMHEYGISASSGQLLTTAYIFVLGLISAMTGYLMNRFDSKKLFFASMASFAVGCAAAIFAPNYPCLLAARLLQAGGAGICLPLVQLVALNIYPKSQYGQATAIVGMIIGFAPAIGPTISGFLIDAWGWRSMFWMLGAIALAVMVLTVLLLDDVVRRPDHSGHFDLASALLYSGGFVLVMVAATMLESGGSVGAGFVAPLLVGAAGLAVFAHRQLRVPEPFLRLQCFRDKTFAVSTLIVICAHMMFMAPSIMVPLFVQDIQGFSATVSGLTLLPGAIMMGVMNPITGRLLDRRGPRPLIVAGCVTVLAGTVAFALIPASAPRMGCHGALRHSLDGHRVFDDAADGVGVHHARPRRAGAGIGHHHIRTTAHRQPFGIGVHRRYGVDLAKRAGRRPRRLRLQLLAAMRRPRAGVRAGYVRPAEDGKRCEIAGSSCHCGEEGWSEGISLLAPF